MCKIIYGVAEEYFIPFRFHAEYASTETYDTFTGHTVSDHRKSKHPTPGSDISQNPIQTPIFSQYRHIGKISDNLSNDIYDKDIRYHEQEFKCL